MRRVVYVKNIFEISHIHVASLWSFVQGTGVLSTCELNTKLGNVVAMCLLNTWKRMSKNVIDVKQKSNDISTSKIETK